MTIVDLIIVWVAIASMVGISLYAGILIGKNKRTDKDDEGDVK